MDWLASFLLSGVTPRRGDLRLAEEFDDVVAWSPAVIKGGYRHYKVTTTLLAVFTAIAWLSVLGDAATPGGITMLYGLFLVVITPTGALSLIRWIHIRRSTGVWMLHPVVALHAGGDVSLVGAVGSSSNAQTATFEAPISLEVGTGGFLDGSRIVISARDGRRIELAGPVGAATRLAAAAR
ncbi:MAG: hypothetical protein KJN81_05570 [Acidimicrobiia bacterium]|nr:hypothetical protein [Acidimicrobiia bacterium]NNL27883.1 hypothetical protein [Acidimicrobiia bacterium]